MSFTKRLRQLAKPIWDAQFKHPFVVALGKGTLPKRKFQYYILQDARYLEELARIFALGAQKAQDPDTALRFAKLVEETIVVERGLHETYGKQWKLSTADMRNTPLAPTNYAYCRHMRSTAQTGTLAELTVVALPCAWIYCVVGRHLLRKGPPKHVTQTSLSGLVAVIRIAGICRSHPMDAHTDRQRSQTGRQGRKRADE